MNAPRLILIEGMIGAGKTTTAGWVEDWLAGRGEDARAFSEFDEDQPIRTRAVDQLRGQPAQEPDAYAASQWRRLAERCRPGRPTLILESVFLQNSVWRTAPGLAAAACAAPVPPPGCTRPGRRSWTSCAAGIPFPGSW